MNTWLSGSESPIRESVFADPASTTVPFKARKGELVYTKIYDQGRNKLTFKKQAVWFLADTWQPESLRVRREALVATVLQVRLFVSS